MCGLGLASRGRRSGWLGAVASVASGVGLGAWGGRGSAARGRLGWRARLARVLGARGASVRLLALGRLWRLCGVSEKRGREEIEVRGGKENRGSGGLGRSQALRVRVVGSWALVGPV
jgi:hypothetical protein